MRPFRTFSTTVSKQCPKWRVSCFKSWRWWQSSIKYDLCISPAFILERNYYRNVALHFCHPLGNLGFILREKIFVGKTTSTPDWTKKKIPKRILWRAKKRDSRTLLTLDQAKKFFLGHHHCTESPFFLNWKVLFVSSSFQAYLLSFPLFPLIAFEA